MKRISPPSTATIIGTSSNQLFLIACLVFICKEVCCDFHHVVNANAFHPVIPFHTQNKNKFRIRTNIKPFGVIPVLKSSIQDSNDENSKKEESFPQKTTSSSSSMSEALMKAAAEHTTAKSILLGVKSIGVDYGLVRTGIAITNGYNPQPFSTVSNLNNTQLSSYIIKLVESEQANQIVMGLPFHKNGTEAEQTIITREFAMQLKCATCAHFGMDAVPIYLWDERYTSKEAAARIRANDPHANLYKELDADAASIILEYYYKDNGIGAERVQLPDNEEIRMAVEKAWFIRKEERRKEFETLTEQRMNVGNKKQQMIEKARILDEKLAQQRASNTGKKKKQKKKKKKKQWIDISPTDMSSNP